MERPTIVSRKPLRALALVMALGLISGCEEGAAPGFLQPKDKTTETSGNSGQKPGQSTKLVERDVEAPEVFQVTQAGLWDGRPSLGGVWVAHADVTDPQRVIIRNSANGKFVIGALFRRERQDPGPRVQVSSDAAAALGMLAGAPVELNVTALIREAVEDEVEEPAAEVTVADSSGTIDETTLDPIAGAAAAIDASEPDAKPAVIDERVVAATTAAAAAAATAATSDPKPKSEPKSSSLSKPFIQIGIFSVKSNAEQAANQMRGVGMVPTVFDQSSNGKRFWRVVVGPSQNKTERDTLLKKVKSTGYSDAYFVTN